MKKCVLLILFFLILFFFLRSAFIFKNAGGYALDIKGKIEKTSVGIEVIGDVVYDKGKTTKEKKELRQRAVDKIKELETLGTELKNSQPEIEDLIRKLTINISLFCIFQIVLLGITVFWKTEKQQRIK